MPNNISLTPAQIAFGDIAPQFADLTDSVLFNQVWAGDELCAKQRSLITLSALITMNRVEQLPFHLNKGLENGLTVEEISAAITHLAFYAGWPCAASAFERLKETVWLQRELTDNGKE